MLFRRFCKQQEEQMLSLSPRRMLVNWFLTSIDLLAEFLGTEFNRENVSKGTNLCVFAQISLLGIVVVSLQLAFIYGIVWLVIILPYQQYGKLPFVVLSVAALTIYLIKLAADKMRSWLDQRSNRQYWEIVSTIWQDYEHVVDRTPQACVRPRKIKKGPSVFQLGWMWLVSIKRKFCPAIKWSEPIPTDKNQRLPKLIMPIPVMAIVMVASAVVTGLGLLTSKAIVAIEANTTQLAQSVTCSYIRAEKVHGAGISTVFQCPEGENWSKQKDLAVYLLNNPSRTAFTCAVYKDGEAVCELPQQ